MPERNSKLCYTDVRCDLGPVPHEHPSEEKTARIDAWYRRLDAMTDAEYLAYFEANGDISEETKEHVRRDVAEGRRRRRRAAPPAERPS